MLFVVGAALCPNPKGTSKGGTFAMGGQSAFVTGYSPLATGITHGPELYK